MRYIVVEIEYCKGCGLCVAVCPRQIIALSPDISPRGYHPAMLTDTENCSGCCACALVCPDSAIEVFLSPNEATDDPCNSS